MPWARPRITKASPRVCWILVGSHIQYMRALFVAESSNPHFIFPFILHPFINKPQKAVKVKDFRRSWPSQQAERYSNLHGYPLTTLQWFSYNLNIVRPRIVICISLPPVATRRHPHFHHIHTSPYVEQQSLSNTSSSPKFHLQKDTLRPFPTK